MKKIYMLTTALIFSAFSMQAQTEVTYYTTMGDFTVKLEDSLTPITVDSFLVRVREGYYDGVTFHRVIDNFMIQGGDPTGTGSGNAGYTIPDEFHPSLKNVPGALSMANTGTPNSGSAQFYINLVTNSHLDNKHTVFGNVISGFNIVQNIGKVATDGNDKPLTPVVMDSLRVTKLPASVNNIKEAQVNIVISPNPTDGIFTIQLPKVAADIIITDIGGKLVYRTSIENTELIDVDMSRRAKGMYIVEVNTEQGSYTQRLLLK